MRVFMMRNFEWHVGAKYQAEVEQGRSSEHAWINVRKIHPFYGDAGDTTESSGEGKPIPFELKDRVDIYLENRNKRDIAKFQTEMRDSSSLNALIRKAILDGKL